MPADSTGPKITPVLVKLYAELGMKAIESLVKDSP